METARVPCGRQLVVSIVPSIGPFGWRSATLLSKGWLADPEGSLAAIEALARAAQG
jgi:hypothetical protein